MPPRWLRRPLLLFYVGCTGVAPARGIQLADPGSDSGVAEFDPGPAAAAHESAPTKEQRPGFSGTASFGGGPDPDAVPVFEPVRTDQGRRYTTDSFAGAKLNISQDQFLYAFEKTEKYGIEFPSAWFMTRDNFLRWTPSPEIWGDHVIESNIFLPAGVEEIMENRIPKTLDFFDFMGVHLSFWADYAEIRGPAPERGSANYKMKGYFEGRLSNDIARFRKQASLSQTKDPSPLRRGTVALVPFAMSQDRKGSKTAGIMLNATFWSLKSQFDAVVLGACHPEDYEFIKRFPAWRALHFTGEYCAQNGGQYLLKHALDALDGKLPDSPEWKRFEYVYFSEGDIVLYLREHGRVLQHLRSSERALVPHRLDTFPAVDDLPKTLRDEVYKDYPYFYGLNLFSTPVSTVDYGNVSCCLSGRVKSTKEFWWVSRGNKSVFPHLESVKFNSDGLPITLASHGAPEVCKVVTEASCR